jgi:Ca2+-binding RTX toxin-like protein
MKWWSLTMLLALMVTHLSVAAAQVAAPVGNGFTVTAGDLTFILKQIKIAERHARAFKGDPTAAPQPNPHAAADPSYCLSMIGSAPDQVPDPLTSYGLRTVDGECNNLVSVLATTSANNNQATPTVTNHPTFGSADQPFPRLTTPMFRTAEAAPAAFGGGPVTSYAQKTANNVVYDTQPRLISNLIVDQTSTNPAAVAAAGFPVRAQNGGNPTVPCKTDPATGLDIQPLTPANCVPAHQTLFIENVTTDVGLSPPFNSLFTFFGQFFDHGVDQTVKSGGTVIIPLRDDDPLIAGPDHILGNADDLPPQLRFMTLPRAQNQPGPDGVLGTDDDVQNANNTDTPWVDQSQTYTSHPSHQVFLREYKLDANNHPVSTGKFLGGLPAGKTYLNSPDGTDGISTWASVKKQAKDLLGLRLVDADVFNVPTILADPYGNFIPGPARGLPQYVTKTGLVEGDLANPVPVPANVLYFDTPFLTDIAHNAEPKPGLVPDDDNTPSSDFAAQPAGTYDDEMLNAHFACGDGRCNENIALSTIHQIFHSEHNRLVDYYTNPVDGVLSLPENAALAADFANVGPTTFTYGERLFQAARFVTEMQYQHLVFEEFARKVQPAVRPFHVYSTDVNAATEAEFAHAVYRFGHSMLDDEVARVNVNPVSNAKTDNSLPLLKAFLNPPEFFNNGSGGFYTPQEAAGAIIMGSSDQAGNEIDEFTTEVLRNNLLGLPLDLPTLNLSRARSEGIPPLNEVRRELFSTTHDAQLAPYTDWSDFGQHLKHPESLINFVAAYGTHPTITSQTTIVGKRNAARAIVNPIAGDVIPADAADFMFGTGAWANDASGKTTTGLDNVDLWVGGLAEVTNLFGGLLGSTFNYVFQTQLEKLQDDDRFYYLNRTPGMNLRTQLEGNSFAELITRNTVNTNTLKQDAFATADCKFQIGNITGPYTAGSPTSSGLAPLTGAGTVNDDPTTDCDENQLLQQKTDGTILYRQRNNINPTGINGQAVYNGTAGVDRINGGNDTDTILGNDGNDILDGSGGDDVTIGGAGDDIILDTGTTDADVLKGGPGNDALNAGGGDDIITAGDGIDFADGGANDNETFAGPGNDFVEAGAGADAVFGDGGDDWIEGGSGQDLLQGDHGAPFFDDPAEVAPGNDIFIGQVGENDYDAEGGDDLMAQNPAIDRNAGAAGFDWAFHQYDATAADDDMMINQQLAGLPLPVVVNRDRWQETEADSGSNQNDIIRGTDDERITGGFGFSGCDALDEAGISRIAGLSTMIKPADFKTSLADVVAVSALGRCPLTANASGNVWEEGNILLGGAGNDLIEGRGNSDIIDGDNELRVRISVRANADGSGGEIASTDLMEGVALSGSFYSGAPASTTLQQAVFAGKVNPGQLVAMREIGTPLLSATGQLQSFTTLTTTPNTNRANDCPAATADPAVTAVNAAKATVSIAGNTVKPTSTTKNCDTSLYEGVILDGSSPTAFLASLDAAYTITANANGSVTVADNAFVAAGLPFGKGDGVDTLWNIENLRFCIGTDPLTKKCNAFQDVLIAPAITVTPTTLAFGNQTVNTISAAQLITVRNTGITNLVVGPVTSSTTDFTATPAAGCASIPRGAACTVSVTFNPASTGAKTATINIASNASPVPSSVTVTGTGTPPVITLSSNSLTFATQNAGTTSAIQTITVRNVGTANVNLTTVVISGPNANQFTQTNTCANTVLRAGRTCTISVRFAPPTVNTAGVKTAVITLNSSVGPSSASLSGTAATPATIGPLASAAFGRHPLNSTTTATVLVTNTGTGPLSVNGVAISGAGSAAYTTDLGTCASGPVAPLGGTCRVNVTFHPTVTGTFNAILTITSNASNNPRSVSVSGRAP